MKRISQRGGAAVEFAIILPLLMVILFGIIEFSLLLYDKAMITNASREGARRGIVYAADGAGNYTPVSDGEITSAVNSYLGNNLITFGGATTANTTVDNSQLAGNPPIRTVTVTYTYTFLVLPNFVATLTGGVTLTASTTMRMEV